MIFEENCSREKIRNSTDISDAEYSTRTSVARGLIWKLDVHFSCVTSTNKDCRNA